MPGVRIGVPRIPTEAMLKGARLWSTREYGRPISDAAAFGCWTAMMDAAIEEMGNHTGIARDGIEAQRGLNDTWPGDPYP